MNLAVRKEPELLSVLGFKGAKTKKEDRKGPRVTYARTDFLPRPILLVWSKTSGLRREPHTKTVSVGFLQHSELAFAMLMSQKL